MSDERSKPVLSNTRLRKVLEARFGKRVPPKVVAQINAIIQDVAMQLIDIADTNSSGDSIAAFNDALSGSHKLTKALRGLNLVASMSKARSETVPNSILE